MSLCSVNKVAQNFVFVFMLLRKQYDAIFWHDFVTIENVILKSNSNFHFQKMHTAIAKPLMYKSFNVSEIADI